MTRVLMKGNEAVGAAAIKAGCRHFFGYPITPQSEVPEYFAREMPKIGGCFLQAESEIAAINMVYGAAGCGARVMTSSSSPGISLKQEGISYLAASELPCLIVNMMRGGPGLGSIQPSQTDYFQATRGGGNGDYRLIVLAPSNVQELVNLIIEGFDLADLYRTPVMVLSDGMVGQMMEPVDFDGNKKQYDLPSKEDWATVGTGEKRAPHIINSLYLEASILEEHNLHLQKKFELIKENVCRVESEGLEGAEVVIAAYGTSARIAKTAIETLTKEGYKVGLIRPITLWPFPYAEFDKVEDSTKCIINFEMNHGQMIDDVRIGIKNRVPVEHFCRTGGVIPTPSELVTKVKEVLGGAK